MKKPERIIITGGPGSGKSTLIKKLKSLGHSCMDEAAREVILQHEEHNVSPWGNIQEFVLLVYKRTMLELQKPLSAPVFCDRSPVDCIAYLKEAGITIPDYLKNFDAHFYYSRKVFILPPWQEIYKQEKARQQDYQKAVLLYKSIQKTYQNCGFLLADVPPLSTAERAKFIFETLDLQQQID